MYIKFVKELSFPDKTFRGEGPFFGCPILFVRIFIFHLYIYGGGLFYREFRNPQFRDIACNFLLIDLNTSYY